MALIDHYIAPLAFAALLASEESLADIPYDIARDDMDRLLDQAVGKARLENPEQADNALFAVCAYADEVLLDSQWQGRDAWMRRKLQEARFQTANAGLEFYERLEELYSAGARDAGNGQHTEALDAGRREALEVYVTCLTLGFRGQYGDARGRSRVDQLTEANLQRVLADDAAPDGRLFPETYAAGFPAPAVSRFKPAVKAALFFGGPLLTAIGVYAFYTYLLAAFVGQWARDLGVPF